MSEKTNSKKVNEKIKNYIIESFNEWVKDNPNFKDIKEYKKICIIIAKTCIDEKLSNVNHYKAEVLQRYYKNNVYAVFKEWCQGLPSILDTLYYYNVSAVEFVGGWLEQTAEEKSKYNEEQAEELATRLLFREINKNANFWQLIAEELPSWEY